jgi:hypothetical protein
MQVLRDISNNGTKIFSNTERNFTEQPTPPYNIGDTWISSDGNLYVCNYQRLSDEFQANDWEIPLKYTDDTTANLAIANAATADGKAVAAQTSATTANNLLSDIASDSKLTPDEKQATKKEWDIIVSEKTLNDSQADAFAVSKVAYGTAYDTLSTYITTLLSNLTTTSDITGTTFRTNFKNYYDARTNLLNAIATKAKSLADTAQSTANTAVTNASTAQTTANSKAKIFYQTSIPTSVTIGDIWFDSDDNNKPYRAAIVGANEIKAGEWEDVKDNSVVRYSTVATKVMTLGGLNNGNGLLEVYDNTGAKTGTFNNNGVSLNSGDFTVIEDGILCTTLQFNNLINDHSFELLEYTGSINATYKDFDFVSSGNYYLWNKNAGSPRIISNIGTDTYSKAKYSSQAAATNSTNNVCQWVPAKPNNVYSFAGYVTRYLRSPSAGTPKLTIQYWDNSVMGSEVLLSTVTVNLTINTTQLSWKRVEYKFTSTSNAAVTDMLFILSSTDANYVYWDGIQLIENEIPCIYNPESQLWGYINDIVLKPNDSHKTDYGRVLIDNTSGITIGNATIGNTTTITGTNLTSYFGQSYVLDLYIGYSSDLPILYTIMLKSGGSVFINHTRNYAGNNDSLNTLFSLTGLGSTSWAFGYKSSKVINSTNLITDTTLPNYKLYKAVVRYIG